MRAEYNELSGYYEIQGKRAKHEFRAIEGAFGWPHLEGKDKELTKYWFVVAGLRKDNVAWFLEEAYGDLHRVVQSAIVAKDNYLLKYIHADWEEEQLCHFLLSEKCDGLFDYHYDGFDYFGRKKYINKPAHWPSFRSRQNEAILVPIPPDDKANIQSGIVNLLTENDDRSRGIEFVPKLKKLPNLTQGSVRELVEHPGSRAMVWVHNSLCLQKDYPEQQYSPPIIYGNVRRD